MVGCLANIWDGDSDGRGCLFRRASCGLEGSFDDVVDELQWVVIVVGEDVSEVLEFRVEVAGTDVGCTFGEGGDYPCFYTGWVVGGMVEVLVRVCRFTVD